MALAEQSESAESHEGSVPFPKILKFGKKIGVPHFIINPYDVLLFLQMSFSLLDDVLTGVCYVCWTFSPQHGGQTVILLVCKPIYIVCIYTCIYIYIICTCLTLYIQYPSTIEKLCVKKLSYCLGALHCIVGLPNHPHHCASCVRSEKSSWRRKYHL